jgi:hypothetical protein
VPCVRVDALLPGLRHHAVGEETIERRVIAFRFGLGTGREKSDKESEVTLFPWRQWRTIDRIILNNVVLA